MSKADVIEMTGTVVETLPNAMFQERSSGTCTYQRKTADKFYPYFTGRSGEGCTFPI